MLKCPECNGPVDVDEEELDEGDALSCDECGAELKVLSKDPLELQSAEELEEDEDEPGLADDDEDEEEEEHDWK